MNEKEVQVAEQPKKKSVLDWIKLGLGLATVLAGAGIIKGKVGDTINKVGPVAGEVINNL